MCNCNENEAKAGADSSSILAVNTGTVLTARGSADCPDFPATPPISGDVVFQCYKQTGCFKGRAVSDNLKLPNHNGYWVQYKVLAISDANGLYYNVPSQPPADLKISFYQSNVPNVDWQLCGAGGYNSEWSTVLAAGQDIWFCGNQEYYIGVNSDDTVAYIPTDQFYVSLQFQLEEASNGFNYMRIEQYGRCQEHDCNKSSGK